MNVEKMVIRQRRTQRKVKQKWTPTKRLVNRNGHWEEAEWTDEE